jgi:hypothetical protein
MRGAKRYATGKVSEQCQTSESGPIEMPESKYHLMERAAATGAGSFSRL